MRDTLKRDTEANWLKAKNFIPKSGEIIIYDYESGPKFKIGDGKRNVSDLPFINSGKIEIQINDAEVDSRCLILKGVDYGNN